MNNIFENAYFGKTYKTRDGRKAIYLRMFIYNGFHYLLSIGDREFTVNEQGKVDKNLYPCGVDIVSEWHEEMNEEELNKLAREYINNAKPLINGDCISCFKAGYRKAIESRYESKRINDR